MSVSYADIALRRKAEKRRIGGSREKWGKECTDNRRKLRN